MENNQKKDSTHPDIQENFSLKVDADPSTRKGVQSDIVMATTSKGITRLDFVLTESSAASDSVNAVLSARIFMSNDDLISLRDMLIKHTETWKISDRSIRDA
jgi:hypothetical protein